MVQSLTPEEITAVEFHHSVRGYARDEVQEFVEAMAKLVADLEEKAATGYLNLGEKMGQLLQQAKDDADGIVTAATGEAERLRAEARASAEAVGSEARQNASDIVATAEEHAAKIVGEAERRVAELGKTEIQIRERLGSLRADLESVAARLRPLENVEESIATEEIQNGAEAFEIETMRLGGPLEDAGL